MLYVNISCLLIYAAIYAVSVKGIKEWEKQIDKKEHKLYFLYPMADFILTKTRLYKILYWEDKQTDSIKALNVTGKPEIIQKLYWCCKISLMIAILFLFHIFSLMVQLQSYSNSKIQDGKYLIRPESGEGSDNLELNVIMDRITKEDMAEADNNFSEDITIKVKERSYSDSELSGIFEKAVQYLDISILGSNESAELIYDNLYFCKYIPGTSISVEWKPEDYNLISRDGTVNNGNIDTKGVITSVSAVLSYQEKQVDFKKQLKIMPKKYSEDEQLQMELEDEIKTSLEKSAEENRVELPETIENYQLIWKEKAQFTEVKILLLGLIAAALAWYYTDQELNQKIKKRKEQMMLDYPEIITKFTLLVNAGMTVKQAWSKITQDYEKKMETHQVKKRYAYEEIRVTVHELKLGVAENDAYEQFGRRTGLISYMKFGTLLAQNLKKGNKGLSELLTREAVEAFEERKETAKRLGEEAGTKLLAPMMVMLLIVFAIILIPAFLTFHL